MGIFPPDLLRYSHEFMISISREKVNGCILDHALFFSYFELTAT